MIALQDLLAAKRKSSRAHDQADVEELLRRRGDEREPG